MPSSGRPDRPDPGTAGSNLAGRDTALPEALWRADELAAALRTAQATLAERERELARAEETIAELSEIVDAAQAALARSHAKAAYADATAKRDLNLRDAIAAELFRLARRRNAEQSGGNGLELGENAAIAPRQTLFWRWWKRLRHPRQRR